MNKNIEKESQDLINSFNEVTGDDVNHAMVVISTDVNQKGTVLVHCAGTASAMMGVQVTAIAQNFDYLLKQGAIEKPNLLMIEVITELTRHMDESISKFRDQKTKPEPYQAAGTH